jgi:hypothetical protein
MTLSPIQGHLYYYGGTLLDGASAQPTVAGTSDAKIDWLNDPIYAALVGPYSPLGTTMPTFFTQDKANASTQGKYWSQISQFDIASQTNFTGTGYAADGVALTTIAPYLDTTTYSPAAYSELFASTNTTGMENPPLAGATTNGFYATNMTYTGLQGVVIYKKTAGITSPKYWPLIGYLDLCGGSINTASTGTISNGQTSAINVTTNTGSNFTTYAAGAGIGSGNIGGQVYVGDGSNWEANTIASVTASSITLTNATSHAYASGTKILQANNASGDKVQVNLGTAVGMFMRLLA